MKVLLIEDEAVAVTYIKYALKFYPEFKLVNVVGSVTEALSFIRNNYVDVVILDIELPDGSGFDILPYFQGMPAIVVITSNENHAFDAFQNGVIDFFVKTMMPYRFNACILKVKDYYKNKQLGILSHNKTYRFVKSGFKYLKFDFDKIVYIESVNEYVRLHFENKSNHLINYSLVGLLDKLQIDNFVQVHRSYAVNVNFINYIDENDIVLATLMNIPIGKTYKRRIAKLLKETLI
ncbi:MAG: LytTR family DNA-binding domain-containing protein [Flavobacterium sp.]|nr:LytTR family DNA-binding domain-containing protein [Flavobacterium sp.]